MSKFNNNIDELKNTLKIVIEDKQDPMKKQRLKYINLFQLTLPQAVQVAILARQYTRATTLKFRHRFFPGF